MTTSAHPDNWRDRVRPDELAHYERVWEMEQETARRAEADGVTYRYIPWHKARGDRSLIGKKAIDAYWVRSGELPWGHQHAHMYAFAFETVINIGPDFFATEEGGSRRMISYDTICVQESTSGNEEN